MKLCFPESPDVPKQAQVQGSPQKLVINRRSPQRANNGQGQVEFNRDSPQRVHRQDLNKTTPQRSDQGKQRSYQPTPRIFRRMSVSPPRNEGSPVDQQEANQVPMNNDMPRRPIRNRRPPRRLVFNPLLPRYASASPQ